MYKALDEETYNRVQEVLDMARRLGKDPIEVMSRHGILLTPEVDKRIRLQAMWYLISQVEQWQPHEFARRHKNPTQADIHMEILRFLKEHASWWEKEQ